MKTGLILLAIVAVVEEARPQEVLSPQDVMYDQEYLLQQEAYCHYLFHAAVIDDLKSLMSFLHDNVNESLVAHIRQDYMDNIPEGSKTFEVYTRTYPHACKVLKADSKCCKQAENWNVFDFIDMQIATTRLRTCVKELFLAYFIDRTRCSLYMQRTSVEMQVLFEAISDHREEMEKSGFQANVKPCVVLVDEEQTPETEDSDEPDV